MPIDYSSNYPPVNVLFTTRVHSGVNESLLAKRSASVNNLTVKYNPGYRDIKFGNFLRFGGTRWRTWLRLKTGRSRVRFPIVPLEFFIDIILPVALWPWS
jgi:hypothetical protein